MLTIAALGMALYGVHEMVVAARNLIGTSSLEAWAGGALLVLGALLVIAGCLVRLRIPGGLAAALGALLALQALALHNAVHLSATPHAVGPHAIRAAVAAGLLVCAWIGDRPAEEPMDRIKAGDADDTSRC